MAKRNIKAKDICHYVIMLCLIIFSGCKLINFAKVKVAITPAKDYAVLPLRNSSVSLCFSTAPVKPAIEKLFSVRSPYGAVDGKISWDNNTCTWTPVSELEPATRYRMMLKGSIPMADGRVIDLEIDRPFYVVRASDAPRLLSYLPLNGSSTFVSSPESSIIELVFSESMDVDSLNKAFSIQPSINKKIVFSPDNTKAYIICLEKLKPCTQYNWKLSSEARSSDGAAISNSLNASFVTDSDKELPCVKSCMILVKENEQYVKTTDNLNLLSGKQAIGILFSKPIDASSIATSIRLEPNISGHAEVVSENLVAYVPDDIWPLQKEIIITVSKNIRDNSGLSMLSDYKNSFTPQKPFMHVVKISSSNNEIFTAGDNTYKVKIAAVPSGELLLNIFFSSAFDLSKKVEAINKIKLTPFFPAWLSSPKVKSISWLSDDQITIVWSGLSKSVSDTTKYYKLSIYGGITGLHGSDDSYLKDNIEIILETLND